MITRSIIATPTILLLALSVVAFSERRSAAAAEEGKHLLAPGDLITVRLWEFEGPDKATTFTEHVGGNGAVPLPLIGDWHIFP